MIKPCPLVGSSARLSWSELQLLLPERPSLKYLIHAWVFTDCFLPSSGHSWVRVCLYVKSSAVLLRFFSPAVLWIWVGLTRLVISGWVVFSVYFGASGFCSCTLEMQLCTLLWMASFFDHLRFIGIGTCRVTLMLVDKTPAIHWRPSSQLLCSASKCYLERQILCLLIFF